MNFLIMFSIPGRLASFADVEHRYVLAAQGRRGNAFNQIWDWLGT
ncbi:hypothetical protein [Mesorhizobium sp. CN2-181]